MNAPAAQSTVVAVKDQVSCETSGEAVVLHLESGVYFGLNPVGAWIWNFIQSPRTVDEVVRAMLSKYEVGREQCERDLHALLQKLAQAKLIAIDGR